MSNTILSVLDLALINQGDTTQQALESAADLAVYLEQLNYKRIWFAEHHNSISIASSATALVIGYVAGKTSSIRVGAGGIMLPNHSPLVVAEQFGTLATLYPDRIDLGLGRAPGTDQATAFALRRQNMNAHFNFKSEIKELQTYFSRDNSLAKVRAIPAEGVDVPIWILGSSTDSAYLAAELGLPYAFAAHFAPAQLYNAIEIYKREFKPSHVLAKPYVTVAVNVIAANTQDEATLLAKSQQMMFLNIVTGQQKLLQPPTELPDIYYRPDINRVVENMLACTFKGTKETLKPELSKFIKELGIDELIVSSAIYDKQAKKKSFAILKEVMDSL